MDLTGKYPRLTDADSVYDVKTYSELLHNAINAEFDNPFTELALMTGWSKYVGGGGYKEGLWYRKLGTNVQIIGMVKGGAVNSPIATLPASLRPPYAAMYPAIAAAQSAAVFVSADGINAGAVHYLFGPAAPSYVNITLLIPLR